MQKIEVYKSEYTGQLFETIEEYNDHVEKHIEKITKKNKEKSLENEKIFLINQPRLTATSIEDFRIKVIELVNYFFKDKKEKLIGLYFESFNFFKSISNSHSCPINGVQNWCGRNTELPTGYIGFEGSIILDIKNNNEINEFIRNINGVNVGSGGSYHNNTLRYNLKLFLDDFPLIKESYNDFIKLNEMYHLNESKKESELSKRLLSDDNYKINNILIVEKYKQINLLNDEINELKFNKNQIEQNVNNNINNEIEFQFDEIDNYKKLKKIFN